MEQDFNALAVEVGQVLKLRRLWLTTAESCTGGMLSQAVTSVPGSSTWFERGAVTYSNAAKVDMLGVTPKTLDTWGAVSEATACEMALGALKRSKANVSIAITGIAGPGGGTPDKPVGTVWFAFVHDQGKIQASCKVFSGDRTAVRRQAVEFALRQLLEFLGS